MDAKKRKRHEDRSDDEKEEKKKKDAVVEDEVEEFFSILKRMQTAVKYFQNHKVDGSGRALTATTNTWTPSFQVEDFQEDNGDRDRGIDHNGSINREDQSGLDLNADPNLDLKQENVL